MTQILRWVFINHSVVSRGKLVGFMSVSNARSGDYWA